MPFSVLLCTGLRVSELTNLKVEWIRRELQIIGKNNTLRLVYLFEEHLHILELYLFLREGKHIESDYLFCSHSSNHLWGQLSRNSVEAMIKEAGIKAWLSEPVWPHKLRHTFATDLLRKGWNIYYIKQLLWHASITTTQTYLTVTNEDLRRTQELVMQPSYAQQPQERFNVAQNQYNMPVFNNNCFGWFMANFANFDRGVGYSEGFHSFM